MLKEYDDWVASMAKGLGVSAGAGEKQEKPDLMRPVEELERDLYGPEGAMRNLYPVDVGRGPAADEEVMRILKCKVLPPEYATSPVWRHAHQLYWQIEALNGNPDAILWHPV